MVYIVSILDAFGNAKRSIQRPAHRHNNLRSEPAIAFGASVREEKNQSEHRPGNAWLICQESSVRTWERSSVASMSPPFLKIARALKCSSAHLMALTEAKLARRLRPSPRTEAGSRRGLSTPVRCRSYYRRLNFALYGLGEAQVWIVRRHFWNNASGALSR